MPTASNSLNSLWASHRSRFHSPSVWNAANPAISLTYVSTGAGFTGPAQLQRFCALFPAESHPFSVEQVTRYNNHYQTVSVVVDEQQRVVTEEIVISTLHLERLDYLLPGVEATHRSFASPFVIIAEYAADCDLLDKVRLYWDQAAILKQLGIFHLAFHNLIKSTGNSISFENELESLPIVDSMKVSQRLVNPTPQNCNQMCPLESLENVAKTGNRPCQGVRLSPIGGLDNISELIHELPHLPNPKIVAPNAREQGHMSSSIFSGENPASSVSHGMRHVPGPVSGLKFGDGSCEPVQPAAVHIHARPSIFGDENEHVRIKPPMTMDPHRNKSHIFEQSNSPFRSDRPIADNSRFTSQIFSNSTPASEPMLRECPSQLRSHIFDVEPIAPVVAHPKAPQSCPFRTDDDPPMPRQVVNPKDRGHGKGLAGHFHGNGLVFQDEQVQQSFSGINPDGRTNRSTLSLGDNLPSDLPRAAVNHRSAMNNHSQINMGDHDELVPLKPSSRVLQPPGGHSTIFLG